MTLFLAEEFKRANIDADTAEYNAVTMVNQAKQVRDAAYYWDDFSPESMAKRFLEGMSDFESHREDRVRAMHSHSLRFSWEESAEQYNELYREVLEL